MKWLFFFFHTYSRTHTHTLAYKPCFFFWVYKYSTLFYSHIHQSVEQTSHAAKTCVPLSVRTLFCVQYKHMSEENTTSYERQKWEKASEEGRMSAAYVLLYGDAHTNHAQAVSNALHWGRPQELSLLFLLDRIGHVFYNRASVWPVLVYTHAHSQKFYITLVEAAICWGKKWFQQEKKEGDDLLFKTEQIGRKRRHWPRHIHN